MESRWLIEAKFAPPGQIRRQIVRAELLDRLEVKASRLNVIQAPAGFGKSTLLRQWASRVAAGGVTVAWLNLDEEDRQLESFVAYLAEAVRRALVATSLSRTSPSASHAGLPARAALTALIAEIERCRQSIALVLDDYHRAESDEVDDAMRLFLERIPTTVVVALATRTPPRVGLARLKAEGLATVISDRELRFSEGETSLFLAAEVARFDQADWVRFAERAEGWPVALQFARMWLGEGGSIAALSAATEASDLGAYLSEQVFGTLSTEQQDFLLRTSPLDSIGEEVAAEIGIDKAALRVTELTRSGLPLVILAQDPLRFRYHHLFQHFLLSRAREQDIDISEIHRLAARWFSRTGDLASAVRHALAGNDPASAAAILERAGGWRLVYRGHGHLGTILRAVHEAFDGTTEAAPRLWLGAAVVAAKRGDLIAASALLERIAASGIGQMTEFADEMRVIDALIRLYCDQPLSEAALARLCEFVGRAAGDDPMTAALGTNLASYFTLERGDFQRARRYGERAIRNFREADALFGELHLYAHIGQAELAAGNIDAAEANYWTMRDLCRDRLGESSDLEAIASVLAAETRYLADDRAAARDLLTPALNRIEEADGWFDIFASAYLTATRLDLNQHGPAAAYAVLQRGRATAERRSIRRILVLLDQERIRVATLSGELGQALALCREQLSLTAEDAGTIAFPVSVVRGDGPALIAARLLIKLDRAEDALSFLDAAERQAQTTGTPLSRRIVTRTLRAFAEDRLGRRARALASLSAAAGLAGPDKFARLLLDEGEEFRRLAEEIADHGHGGTVLAERIRHLLDRRRPDAPGTSEPADFALTPRERQVLDLLAEGLTNKEIGRRIGVDPNTVKYHLKHLFAKLSVERRVSAVVRARNYGLIA